MSARKQRGRGVELKLCIKFDVILPRLRGKMNSSEYFEMGEIGHGRDVDMVPKTEIGKTCTNAESSIAWEEKGRSPRKARTHSF